MADTPQIHCYLNPTFNESHSYEQPGNSAFNILNYNEFKWLRREIDDRELFVGGHSTAAIHLSLWGKYTPPSVTFRLTQNPRAVEVRIYVLITSTSGKAITVIFTFVLASKTRRLYPHALGYLVYAGLAYVGPNANVSIFQNGDGRIQLEYEVECGTQTCDDGKI